MSAHAPRRFANRGFSFDAIAVLAALGIWRWNPGPIWIEAHYANGVYPIIDRGVRAITGPLPFCLGDVLFVVAVALLARFWFVVLAEWRGRIGMVRAVGRGISRTVAIVCAIYVWFAISWATDYGRVSLADKIPVHNDRTDEDTVGRFGNHVADQLRGSAAAAHRERLTDDEVARRLVPTFEATIARLGDRATFAPPRIKPTFFQPMFQASATTGFTDPWTHEVNLDATLFAVERPAVYAHEWSHISGFNDEAEANFIAVVACTTSRDPLLVYSGWLLVWENLPQNTHVTHPVGRIAYDDIVAIRARYAKNVNRQVERVSRAAYDGYLKSNHVKAGYASYGLFVRWLTGADYDRHGLPIVRDSRIPG